MDRRNILKRFNSWEEVSPADEAWITMDAIAEGKNPVMKKAGYKAAFTKRANAAKTKVKTMKTGCAVCPYKIRFEKISKVFD